MILSADPALRLRVRAGLGVMSTVDAANIGRALRYGLSGSTGADAHLCHAVRMARSEPLGPMGHRRLLSVARALARRRTISGHVPLLTAV
jgi:hypothetical protein